MEFPTELQYSEEHVWVKTEGRRVRLGLTDFIQRELGDIVFAELPRIGDEVQAGEPFGSVESVKSVTELYSPVSGKVAEVNRELADFPNRINLDPYAAWIAVVELSAPEETESLWTAEAYAQAYGTAEEPE